MATSGSYDFTSTRDDIIKGAMRLMGVLAAGESPTAEETADGAEALQQMLKAWMADGVHLWTLEEATLFLTVGTASYSLGPSGDHATKSYTATALAAAAVAADTTITVDSITGISNGDNIGIVRDDGTFKWTTVNGAPSGTTVTLSAAVGGAAAIDNAVYAYTSKIQRPLRIKSARRYVFSSAQETPFASILSRQEYFDLPNKTSQGAVTQGYYDPKLTTGTFYLWPAPNTIADGVKFTFMEPFEDVDSASNNFDFPVEWLSALKFNLAYEWGPEFEIDPAQWSIIEKMAVEKKASVTAWDAQDDSVFFQAG